MYDIFWYFRQFSNAYDAYPNMCARIVIEHVIPLYWSQYITILYII